MTHVEDDAQSVALRHHLDAKLGEAAVGAAFGDAVARGVAIVPRQPQVAQAEPVELAQHADAGVERLRAFQAGDAGDFAFRLGAQDVIGAARQHKLVGQVLGQQVQLVEALQRVGDSAVTLIGRGHVASKELDIDAALAQPWQIDMANVGAIAEPATLFKLVANAVAMAVDHKGIEMERQEVVRHTVTNFLALYMRIVFLIYRRACLLNCLRLK